MKRSKPLHQLYLASNDTFELWFIDKSAYFPRYFQANDERVDCGFIHPPCRLIVKMLWTFHWMDHWQEDIRL